MCLYINCCGISSPLFSCFINFFSFVESRTHRKEEPDDPELADDEDIQMEYSSD